MQAPDSAALLFPNPAGDSLSTFFSGIELPRRLHRAAALRSYLHVAADNPTAIALYGRLGFLPRSEFPLYSVRRAT